MTGEESAKVESLCRRELGIIWYTQVTAWGRLGISESRKLKENDFENHVESLYR